MADQAGRRIQALSAQMASSSASGSSASSSESSLPAIKRVAAPSNALRLEGKVAIITGTNSPMGIGRATAHQYAESGVKALYICDYDGSHLEEHKRQIEATYPGVEVHPRQFDAADEAQVKGVVDDAMGKYGRLDIFFANAGIVGPHVSFTDCSVEDFMAVQRTNSLSVFLAAKHAAPAMMKTSDSKPHAAGSIIGTASTAGIRSNAGTTAYSASKAAVVSIAQTVSYQLAGTNVRINAICPGIIETGMTAPVYESARAKGREGKIGHINPMKRGGHADEIARVALFLGSDESSYVNGQAWLVDGGLSAGHPYVPGKMA